PHAHKENGFNLGYWVNMQRRDKEDLSEERRQRLDKLRFVWDAHQARWEENFLHLKAYKEREGNCEVPRDHIESGVKLGRWLIKQRSKRNTLSDDCRRRLNELGIVWHARDGGWEEGYRHLKAYKEREGDCLVPLSHKENNFPLGTWVSNQRARAECLSVIRR